jgi:hypothetical protein
MSRRNYLLQFMGWAVLTGTCTSLWRHLTVRTDEVSLQFACSSTVLTNRQHVVIFTDHHPVFPVWSMKWNVVILISGEQTCRWRHNLAAKWTAGVESKQLYLCWHCIFYVQQTCVRLYLFRPVAHFVVKMHAHYLCHTVYAYITNLYRFQYTNIY